jgi:hypothetical protein
MFLGFPTARRASLGAWQALLALGFVLLLLVADEALARVGGGGTFRAPSRPSSSGGGSFGGSSGGGDGSGEALYLLLRLCIEYPQLGVPLLLIVLAFFWYNHNQHGHGHVSVERGAHQERMATATSAADPAWTALVAHDPALSRPVLEDYIQLVYRRAWAAAATRSWDPLAPYFSDAARPALERAVPAGAELSELVVASVTLQAVRPGRDRDRLVVGIESSRRLAASGVELRQYTQETWTFERAAGAISKPPEEALRLGCPSCGVAVQCDNLGRCTSCSTPITTGQLSWQVAAVRIERTEPLGRPELASSGGTEPSWHAPTVIAADLPAAVRAFHGRHPHFQAKELNGRIAHVFIALQEAWGRGRWADARPFTTDMAWNTLRFWMDTYARAGLANRVADPKIERTQIVRVTIDAWYESITVRLWATMRDWVEEAGTGKVVGGSPSAEHRFSEYWTFIRAVGSGDQSKDPTRCPSCGAPLDQVNAAGECGYCNSVITTGKYDWVPPIVARYARSKGRAPSTPVLGEAGRSVATDNFGPTDAPLASPLSAVDARSSGGGDMYQRAP